MRRTQSHAAAALLALAGLSCTSAREEARATPAEGELTVVVSIEPAGAQGPESAPEVEEEEVRDGRWLYVRNCSGCHGETGQGDGDTAKQLGVVARDFAQGGFSFGNTPEALFRTISSGVPGRSVMPAFAGVLSDEERWMVVDFVRTLMPPQEPVDTKETEIVVGRECVIARGKLPPVREGLPDTVRGLLIGTPEGMTFEYAIDDVRLLAVRQGAFADREDWHDRGGGYLKPLGQVMFDFTPAEFPGGFESGFGSKAVPLRTRMVSSWTRGTEAGLEYSLVDSEGTDLARVEESCRFVGASFGGAAQRRLAFRASGEEVQLSVSMPTFGWVSGVFSWGHETWLEVSESPAGWHGHVWLGGTQRNDETAFLHLSVSGWTPGLDQEQMSESLPDGRLKIPLTLEPGRETVFVATYLFSKGSLGEHLHKIAAELKL